MFRSGSGYLSGQERFALEGPVSKGIQSKSHSCLKSTHQVPPRICSSRKLELRAKSGINADILLWDMSSFPHICPAVKLLNLSALIFVLYRDEYFLFKIMSPFYNFCVPKIIPMCVFLILKPFL